MSKADTLKARWSKREKDVLYSFPRKADGALLHTHLGCHAYWHDGTYRSPLLEELEKRGYDLTTLTFSIKLKPLPPSPDDSHDGSGKGEECET